jgi:putative membrane protein
MSLHFDSTHFAWVASAVLLGACAGETRDAEPEGADPTEEPAASTSESLVAWSDAELAGVLLAANDAVIAEAGLALARSGNPAVLEFAGRMIADHTLMNQDVAAMLAQLVIAPLASPLSATLAGEGARELLFLDGLAGPVLDRWFLQFQTKGHRRLMSLLNGQIVAQGRHPGVQALVLRVRATVAQQLAYAIGIQASLGPFLPGPVPLPGP